MEAPGDSIGGASLRALFKTSLKMYDTIECGRRYGQDHEILTTKLGIERVRLFFWGDNLGLLGREDSDTRSTMRYVDPRLQDPRNSKTVSDILNSMRQLFDGTNTMTRRYGLQPAQGPVDSGPNALMSTFKRTYAQPQALTAHLPESVSTATKARWVIKDKKRFERFIDDLRDINDSLFELFPDIDARTRLDLVAEIKASASADDLRITAQAVADLENHEELVGAVNQRIVELPQPANISAAGQPDAGILVATGGADNPDVDHLSELLGRVEVFLGTKLDGSLRVYVHNSHGAEYFASTTWEDITGDEYLAQREELAGYVRHPHLAWCKWALPAVPSSRP